MKFRKINLLMMAFILVSIYALFVTGLLIYQNTNHKLMYAYSGEVVGIWYNEVA